MNKYITISFLISSIFTMEAQEISTNSIDLDTRITKALNIQTEEFNQKLSVLGENHSVQSQKIAEQLYQLTTDYKISQLELDKLKLNLIETNEFIKVLEKQVISLESQLKKEVNSLTTNTDALGVVANNLAEGLTTAEKTVIEIAESSSKNSDNIQTVTKSLSQKQQYGLIIIGFSLVLILAIYILLSKKWSQDTKKLAAKQKEIFEKQIQDSQQITDWLSNESAGMEKGSKEVDHSFAKRVADEIVRITTNLSRMDESIKGFKQLAASVRKLEQSLNANQYELEDLLNKPYNSGMNIQANIIIDENLKAGESTITRIIKPQINFKGKLIQAAQVEVSQGE